MFLLFFLYKKNTIKKHLLFLSFLCFLQCQKQKVFVFDKVKNSKTKIKKTKIKKTK